MRKLKLLLAGCALMSAPAVWAQTDVTSTYLQNADFSKDAPLTNDYLYGYGKDAPEGEPWGLQEVTDWTIELIAGDNAKEEFPNSGLAGGIFSYGSSTALKGNNVAAPTTSPNEGSGQCLGFFAVWGCGAYYYQEVTLAAGVYTISVQTYNQSGTQANTSYIGFIPDEGDSQVGIANTTVGEWVDQKIHFTLTEATAGRIALGYLSTGNGSGSNPMLFFDGVKIEYTDLLQGVKNELSKEIEAAKALDVASEEQSALSSAISAAEGVLSSGTKEEDFINAINALKKAEAIAINKLSSASSSSPSANLLVNGSFDTEGEGWTLQSMKYQNNQERPTRYVEQWSGGALSGSGSATQTIKSLPAGYYVLNGTVNAQLQSDKEQEIFGVTLSVNDEAVYPSGVWKDYEIVYNHQADGDIAVTFIYDGSNANWVAIDEFSLVYVGSSFDADAYPALKYKADWEKAVADAEAARDNESYVNVTGQERSMLESEINKPMPSTVDGMKDAIEALKDAVSDFTAAKSAYDALAAANVFLSSVPELPYAESSKKPSTSAVTANTAEQATEAANNIYPSIRAYYESHAKAEGVSGAVEMTDKIANADASNGNNDWTWEGSKNNPRNNESWTDSEGRNDYMYFDGGDWNGTGWTTTMEQAISLPAGKYLLTAKGRASTGVTLTMSVGENSVELPNVGASGNVFNRGWNDGSVEFETEGDDITILVTATTEGNHEWFSISDFRLVQLEAISVPMAGADDYAKLAAAINDAESHTLGFDAGEYAPCNNVEAIEALLAAKTIDPEAAEGNTLKSVNAAIDALTSSIWFSNSSDDEFAIVYNGMFETVQEGANYPEGWTRTNAWGQMQSGLEGDYATAYYNQPGSLQYGNNGAYLMPLKANTAYKLTFAYRSHEDNSNRGVNVTVQNGEDVCATASFPENPSTTDWVTVSKVFQTGDAGNYVLTLGNGGNTWMTAVSIEKAKGETVTVGEAGYATYVSDADLDYSGSGIKAYTAKIEGNTVALTQIEKVPAGTPVVLYAENGATVEIPVATTTDEVADNQLIRGTGAAVPTDDGSGNTNYVLNNVDGIGFYYAAGLVVPTNRAYLSTAGGSARLNIVFSGEATGIKTIDNALLNSNAVYNLSGQRVQKAQKGLYITNGKKVVVK